MKFASLEQFQLSPWRVAGLGVAMSVAGGATTGVVVGDSLGQGKATVAVLVGALILYAVLSAPRRLADTRRVAQARESPVLSASAYACLAVTGSRPRTLILLRAREPTLSSALKEAARRVLTGTNVDSAVERSAGSLVSYSAASALRGLASFTPGGISQGDEETRGLAASSDLSQETKVPMMTTVCFFAPILLLLYAVFSRSYDPTSLAELACFEFIVVDIAFYLGAADRGTR